jgi:hypothetical protein
VRRDRCVPCDLWEDARRVSDVDTQSLVEQLETLYAERELLERELGTADARELIARVRELEARLADAEQRR